MYVCMYNAHIYLMYNDLKFNYRNKIMHIIIIYNRSKFGRTCVETAVFNS